jgi:hypothetical protein
MSETTQTTQPDPRVPNESTLRTNSSLYNQGTKQRQLVHEIHNTAYNHRHIIDAFDEGRARDLDDEPKAKLAPAFVIGSGPSLDDSIGYLKDWQGGILCTTSHALTLMYHGIEPTHIVALDPFSLWDEIKGIDWSKTRTKLVLQPGVWPELVENWPNEMLLYLQNVGRDSFYNQTQRFMFTTREGYRDATFRFLIRTEVTQFACSPVAQMFVADRLGYGNIFLAGVDFCYHSNKERFTSYTVKTPARKYDLKEAGAGYDLVELPEETPIEWERHDHPYVSGPSIIMTNNGHPSEQVHLYYLKNMISGARLSEQDIYTTDHGALVQFPYVPIDEVMRKHGRDMKKVPKNEKLATYDEYLATIGAFVLETAQGKLFIECEDPERDLGAIMQKINRKYLCSMCKAEPESLDDVDHSGEPCPQCKGPITRPNSVDVEANFRRIRRLVAAAEERRKASERPAEEATA